METFLEDIRAIRNNGTLNENEKKQQIEQLMAEKQRANAQPLLKSEEDNYNLSCLHYPTKACSRFYFSCCGLVDPCRRCHQERGCTETVLDTIECNECQTRQPPSSNCRACNIRFAKSYCDICHIWTEKDIVHCNECQLCRVGKLGEIQHCSRCDCCYPNDIFATHYCNGKSMRAMHCPICAESVYSTQKLSCILPCKHVVHQLCLTESLQKGHYRCPLCRKCMGDMQSTWDEMRLSIMMQPMHPSFLAPIKEGDTVDTTDGDFIVRKIHREEESKTNANDYWCDGELVVADQTLVPRRYLMRDLSKKISANIYCFDCEEKSTTIFHYVGLECKNCGSFNTTRE